MIRSRAAWVLILATCALVAVFGVTRVFSASSTATDNPFNVPGVPATSSPLRGTVNEATIEDNVFRIPLRAGQWFYARVVIPAGADLDMHLFAPGTASVAATEPALVSAESSGTPAEKILYRVMADGDYYLNVWAYRGGGEYTVDYGFPSVQPALAISAPTTVTWAGTASLEGTFSASGSAVSGVSVELLQRPAGAYSFRSLMSTRTAQGGRFRFQVKPSRRVAYAVRFSGDPTLLPVTSVVQTVAPLPALSAPLPLPSVRAGRTFVVTGTLKPRHAAGTKTVKVSCYRLKAGRWVYSHKVTATNADHGSLTRYSARIKLSTAGKWKLVAAVGETSRHAAGVSAPARITVRP